MIEPRAQSLVRAKRTLSIMPTFTCTASCSNCASRSSPTERTNLPLQSVLSAITQARELNFWNVVFTGGEATLRWNDLLAAIKYATSLGFPTRLVTNGYWAISTERATHIIDQLVDAGLTEINYSTGDEHIRFVPLDRVALATIGALKRELPVYIMVELTDQGVTTKTTVINALKVQGCSPADIDRIGIEESPWMPLSAAEIGRYPAHVPTTCDNLSGRTGCSNILQTYTIQADGRIGACCGIGLRDIPGLNVQDVSQPDSLLNAINTAENDFLKLWLRYEGPERILQWASQYEPTIEWDGLYAHRCQACARIHQDQQVQRVIRDHHEEMIPTVLQNAWLQEVYIPEALAREH